MRIATLGHPMSGPGDDRLARQARLALVRLNLWYWPTVAPTVRRALRHWEDRAGRIPDPSLRALALEKLSGEGFNANLAATLATLAPLRQRTRLTKAIVALEVLFDYVDGLSESPSEDAMRNGRQLHLAFTDAFTASTVRCGDYYRYHVQPDDDGYLQELAATVRHAFSRLPSRAIVLSSMYKAAARCTEAQVRAHAVPSLGVAQLEEWAQQEATQCELGWREFLAGAASSVLAVHALMTLAADRWATQAQADAIDGLYHSIGVLSTMLDGVIDYDQDESANAWGYIRLYEDFDMLSERLVGVVRNAVVRARSSTHAAHHLMTLAGVVAYYGSAPAAREEPARSVFVRLQQELHPLGTHTLAFMRGWRLARVSGARLSQAAGRWTV